MACQSVFQIFSFSPPSWQDVMVRFWRETAHPTERIPSSGGSTFELIENPYWNNVRKYSHITLCLKTS